MAKQLGSNPRKVQQPRVCFLLQAERLKKPIKGPRRAAADRLAQVRAAVAVEHEVTPKI